MNGVKKNRFKIICGFVLLVGAVVLTMINVMSNKGVKIVKWDNFYDGNNIVFFYEEQKNEKLELLKSKYKIEEQINAENDELSKVMKVSELINKLVKKEVTADTGLNNGYDILLRKTQSNKSSVKDMAIITRDFLNSVGFRSRIGVFRKGESKYRSDIEYYVLEYWSTEFNKWVMIDFIDMGYFLDDDSKLSAIEVINSDIKKISYMGNTSQIDYKNNINKYFDSYSLAIENSSEKTRSNCNVTYIKNDTAVEYRIQNTFARPTVFTKETRLFEKSPFDKLVGTDEKAYLLVCGAISNDDENSNTNKKRDKKDDSILIAAFKDDSVMKSFYLNLNNQGYEHIDDNKELKLKKGINTIELSLDGKTTVSSVTIEKK